MEKVYKPKESVHFALSIDKEIMDKIRELAEKDFRSVNKQIVYLVKKGLDLELSQREN